MNPSIFFFVFVATVIALRISVLLIPNINFRFYKVSIHHFWFGFIVIITIYLLPLNPTLSLIGFAVGLGLIVDELVFMLLGAGGDREYFSILSNSGTIVIISIAYIFLEKIFWLFTKI